MAHNEPPHLDLIRLHSSVCVLNAILHEKRFKILQSYFFSRIKDKKCLNEVLIMRSYSIL